MPSMQQKCNTLNTEDENEVAENLIVDMENQNSNGFEGNSVNMKNVEKNTKHP